MSDERWATFWATVGLAAALILMVATWLYLESIRPAFAQHTHKGALGLFYQSWMMPDSPKVSCCSDQDCAPAASRFTDGKWQAEADGEWVDIPAYKIEQERDSPDGRSHLCGRKALSGFTVLCFIRGSGT